jgi:hypothetical protein
LEEQQVEAARRVDDAERLLHRLHRAGGNIRIDRVQFALHGVCKRQRLDARADRQADAVYEPDDRHLVGA